MMRKLVHLFVILLIGHYLGLTPLRKTVGANELATLSGLLRTYQVSACDNESLHVECDSRTVVTIVVGYYGMPTPQKFMCRSYFQRHNNGTSAHQLSNTNQTLSNDLIDNNADSNRCLGADHLRYLFVQKIESVCREQSRCSLKLTPKALGIPQDPCDHIVKYAELAYKCRPNRFINKILCEGSRIKLTCNDEDRIVIFTAYFGSTIMGVSECPNTSTLRSMNKPNWNMSLPQLHMNCHVNNASETVWSICQGKRTCSINADVETFGTPYCPMKVNNFLKVVYTCTSRKMLKSSIEEDATVAISIPTPTIANEQITTERNQLDIKTSLRNHFDDHIRKQLNNNDKNMQNEETNLLNESVHPIGTQTKSVNCTLSPSVQVIGFISDWISAVNFLKKNRERFILYLLISLFVSLLCFLVVLSVKLYLQKSAAKRKVRESQMPPTPFEIIDLEDDIPDDDLLQPRYPEENIEIHRQPYTTVPNATVSVLNDPRPLLYSTIRKPKSMVKYSGSPDYADSGNSNYTPSPLSTLPKSILTNRNSLSGSQNRELKNNGINNNGERHGGSVLLFHKKKNGLLNGGGDKQRNKERNRHNGDDEDTQPRMLSKSLNNFFM